MSELGDGHLQMDRAEAARLLRAARAARAAEADELIDWAQLALPESRPVRLMKIRQLIAEGDNIAADALIARGLLAQPSDAALTTLRARSLLAQARLEEADKEIHVALDRRPRHAEALVLGGRIARRRGEHRRAVDLLARAIERRPHEEALRKAMVQWLLDAGLHERAEAALSELTWPHNLLRARVLRARGRRADAAELLERSIERDGDPARLDHELAELVAVLEEIGDLQRLEAAIEQLDEHTPRARLAAARAMLPLGAFRRAAKLAAGVSDDHVWQRAAAPILVVASALDGRPELARSALDGLPGGPRSLDVRAVSACWRRGLRGTMVTAQRTASLAGADPSRSVLQPLLQEALRLFERELGAAPADDDTGDAAELQRLRAECLAAMGRTLEAAASWARDVREPPPALGRIGPGGPLEPTAERAA